MHCLVDKSIAEPSQAKLFGLTFGLGVAERLRLRQALDLVAIRQNGQNFDSNFGHRSRFSQGTVRRARALLQTPNFAASNSTMVCNAKCRTQVLALQALILGLTLLSALLSGFCLMHALDTPTRFEAPKDARGHE